MADDATVVEDVLITGHVVLLLLMERVARGEREEEGVGRLTDYEAIPVHGCTGSESR